MLQNTLDLCAKLIYTINKSQQKGQIMKVFKVDLYEYFKVEKPQNADGVLYCYLVNQAPGININRKHPAMLILPGGGYSHTSDREAEPVALKFLSKDYNAFILRYSCKPVKHPVQLQETAMAMAYIRSNANELNVREDKVAVIGFSAGGHLAGMTSLLYNDESLNFLGDKKALVRPNETIYMYPVVSNSGRAHVSSFNNICGDDEQLKERLSLENLVTSESPACFIVSTFEDGSVPCQNSLKLATAYDDKRVPFSIHIFEKGVHGMSIGEQSVYNTGLPYLSAMAKDYPKWVDMALVWLEERGYKIIDK